MHHGVWPEIEAMMLNDAHFQMVLHARRLTKKFNGPTAKLLQDGYLVQQMVTIGDCVMDAEMFIHCMARWSNRRTRNRNRHRRSTDS
jgi:hypothetical protein